MRSVKFFLSLLCALLPIFVFSQNGEPVNYLANAVPELDGKVCFQKEIYVGSISSDFVFDIVENWAKDLLAKEQIDKNNKSQLFFSDKQRGAVSINFEHFFVFKSTALSLDRAKASYIMTINISNGKCIAELKNFKYLYSSINGDKQDLYLAEDWITDEQALNKAKTKMYPLNAKFRKATINRVNELFSALQVAIDGGIAKERVNVSSNEPLVPSVAATVAASSNAATSLTNSTASTASVASSTNSASPTNFQGDKLEGFKSVLPNQLEGNVIKMISEDWMLVTAGTKDKFNTMTASWGALGYLYNKPVAVCFISPSRYTYEFMESSDTYTLTFFTEDFREVLKYCGSVSGRQEDKIKGSRLSPLELKSGAMAFKQAKIIIECKKLLSQQLDAQAIHDKEVKEKRSKSPMHKMYIGEIINVWIK